jgi:hypothetical protein
MNARMKCHFNALQCWAALWHLACVAVRPTLAERIKILSGGHWPDRLPVTLAVAWLTPCLCLVGMDIITA